MVKSVRHSGNFNLKGKKEVLLGCRCCTARDFREDELKKEHEKDIQEAILDHLESSNDK